MQDASVNHEKVQYQTLLVRKNRSMRWLETILFLVGFGIVFAFTEYRSTEMVISLIGWAVITYLLSPALYLFVMRPEYGLYEQRLEMKLGKNKKEIPLTEVEKEPDLPYYFLIAKKRTPILASDSFLRDLNERLEVMKHERRSKK
ncbi:hypothetical protein IC620_08045 [Hazenella sp. IB182357]|uniref:Uncharacterized protein n=1 Tax=Polycladospora coralii TaxID=2771432 RepID=A0A926NBJ2_9BACL|nr:hypothetical protein [Polycladospora coralii]MBD1372305.1 hypothetical protein [Polycladospora coralii]